MWKLEGYQNHKVHHINIKKQDQRSGLGVAQAISDICDENKKKERKKEEVGLH